MNLCLDETCIIKHVLQLLWRIGRHTLHHICPHRVTINDLHHDGELTARLQYTTHFLQAVGKVGPEIHSFDCRYEVELPVLIGKLLGRTLSYEYLFVEHFGIYLLGFRHTRCILPSMHLKPIKIGIHVVRRSALSKYTQHDTCESSNDLCTDIAEIHLAQSLKALAVIRNLHVVIGRI